jgi:hypothetical protein
MSCCRVLLRNARISTLGGDLLVSVQLASHVTAWHQRLPFDGRFGLPLPRPSISALPAPRPGTDQGRARTVATYPSFFCTHAVTPSMRPMSVGAISIRGSWPVNHRVAWSGHPRVAGQERGEGEEYLATHHGSFSIFDSFVPRGPGLLPCLEIWIIRRPGWSQVVQMVHIAVVWPCCPCPSTAQCPATSST